MWLLLCLFFKELVVFNTQYVTFAARSPLIKAKMSFDNGVKWRGFMRVAVFVLKQQHCRWEDKTALKQANVKF